MTFSFGWSLTYLLGLFLWCLSIYLWNYGLRLIIFLSVRRFGELVNSSIQVRADSNRVLWVLCVCNKTNYVVLVLYQEIKNKLYNFLVTHVSVLKLWWQFYLVNNLVDDEKNKTTTLGPSDLKFHSAEICMEACTVYECVWDSLLLISCCFIFRDYGWGNSCSEGPGLENPCFRCTEHSNDFIVLQNDNDNVGRNNLWGLNLCHFSAVCVKTCFFLNWG